jgi:hypothetical protein
LMRRIERPERPGFPFAARISRQIPRLFACVLSF